MELGGKISRVHGGIVDSAPSRSRVSDVPVGRISFPDSWYGPLGKYGLEAEKQYQEWIASQKRAREEKKRNQSAAAKAKRKA